LLGWAPSTVLKTGLEKTFKWIDEQVAKEEQAGKDVTVYAVSHVVRDRKPEDPSGI